jgi:hypothetical protein
LNLEDSMSNLQHAVIWIDHQQARIFKLEADELQASTVHSTHPHQHLHHKANSMDSGHAVVDKAFLAHVAASIKDAGVLLIAGPASAKQELVAYLAENEPATAARIASVQPMDHPSDGEIVAFARKFFKADDRMHSQSRGGMHQ